MVQSEKLRIPVQIQHWVDELRDSTQPVWLRDNTAQKLELLTSAISAELEKYSKSRIKYERHYERKRRK